MKEPSVRARRTNRFVLDLHDDASPDRTAVPAGWSGETALLALSYSLSGAQSSADVAHAVQDWARLHWDSAFVALSLTEPPGRDGAGRLWIGPCSLGLTQGTGLARVALTGQPLAQSAPDRADLHFLRSAGVVSGGRRQPAVLHLPLRDSGDSAAGSVLGVLTFGWTSSLPVPLDPSGFAALDLLARHAARALGRALAFEQVRTVAEVLRSAVLPEELPQPEGWRLAATYVPARRQPAVGGDWYDAFPLPDGRLALAVGDAAGHGLEAARVMSGLRNALRAYAVLGEGPRRVVERLDTFVARTDAEAFATVVYLEVDPADGAVIWASAGHPPPLVIPHDVGEPRYAAGPADPVDPPLGVPAAGPRHETTLRLAPADTVLLFTDGLVERRDRDVDAGLELLRVTAAESARNEPPEHVEAVLERLLDAAGPADDVCVMALSRVAASRRRGSG